MGSAEQHRVAILGASRGLGRALSDLCTRDESVSNLLRVSRKPDEKLATNKSQLFSFDLSSDNLSPLMAELEHFEPTKVIYMAGGGPFAQYEKSKWSSHQWALRVSFLAAAELLHWFLCREKCSPKHQFVFVGSSIAEDKGDPKASSYAASKHAMVGLFQSIQAEKPQVDFRLFSPGYMDTDMLPKGSWPRQQKAQLWTPEQVAGLLWNWCCDPGQMGGHMSLGAFAETPRNTH